MRDRRRRIDDRWWRIDDGGRADYDWDGDNTEGNEWTDKDGPDKEAMGKDVVMRDKRATDEDGAPMESTMEMISRHGHARREGESSEHQGEGQDEGYLLHVRASQ